MWFGLFVVLALTAMSESANILCFAPTASISHQLMPRAWMKRLAERGHNVTLFTTDPFESALPNLVQHSWRNSYELVKQINFARISDLSVIKRAHWFSKIAMATTEIQLQHPAIAELLANNQTFDLVVVEALGETPFYAFAGHFNAPLLGFTTEDSPAMAHAAVGNYIHPIAYSSIGPNVSNLFERLYAVYVDLRLYFSNIERKIQQSRLIERYFGPGLGVNVPNLDFLIFSNHPVFGSIRPTVPASLAVGFMHIEPVKPLPGDLAAFFQRSKRGVIYFSLGSSVKSADLNKKVLKTFCDVFRNLDYDILWKFEASNLPNQPDNVKIVKWLPQQDVLAHPKLRLFITQGGQQSIEEAVHHAVPMLVIPFHSGQMFNAKRIERLGVGRTIDIKKLTPVLLETTLNGLLRNESYRENVKGMSMLAKDQPMTALDRSVWWTEYVIRHKGAKHLHAKSKKFPAYQFLMVDIGLAFVVFFVFLAIALKKLYKLTRSASRKQIKLQ